MFKKMNHFFTSVELNKPLEDELKRIEMGILFKNACWGPTKRIKKDNLIFLIQNENEIGFLHRFRNEIMKNCITFQNVSNHFCAR